MNIEDLGKGIAGTPIGDYCRGGLILDLHLSHKLSWEDAVMWAKEFRALDSLHLLEGRYNPDPEVRVMHWMGDCEECKRISAPFKAKP